MYDNATAAVRQPAVRRTALTPLRQSERTAACRFVAGVGAGLTLTLDNRGKFSSPAASFLCVNGRRLRDPSVHCARGLLINLHYCIDAYWGSPEYEFRTADTRSTAAATRGESSPMQSAAQRKRVAPGTGIPPRPSDDGGSHASLSCGKSARKSRVQRAWVETKVAASAEVQHS